MSKNDVATQLHHALFNTSPGYMLKPATMLRGLSRAEMDRDVSSTRRDDRTQSQNITDAYWPAPCEKLHVVTVTLLSCHNLPKVSPPNITLHQNIFCQLVLNVMFASQRGERRPSYNGSRKACHNYAPELSGDAAPPTDADPSCPALQLELHPTGGRPFVRFNASSLFCTPSLSRFEWVLIPLSCHCRLLCGQQNARPAADCRGRGLHACGRIKRNECYLWRSDALRGSRAARDILEYPRDRQRSRDRL
jgi:hypothetical protein